MCDACDEIRRSRSPRPWSRRHLLGGAVVSGVAMATSPLWRGSVAVAAPDAGSDPSGEDGRRGVLFTSGAAAQRTIDRPPGVVVANVIPAPNLGGPPAPKVVPRKTWGADESLRSPRRAFAPIRKLVVHHSASPNRPSDPAAVVREMYLRDVVDRGYGDIGYNFVIDHHGVIYEGRYSRRYGNEPITGEDHRGFGVVGAHAKNMNAGTCGICLIGNFETAEPTAEALHSLLALLQWKAGRHRIDASVADPFENVYGNWRTFGNVAGHRNVGDTVCPGKHLYALLGGLRNEVVQAAGHWPTLVANIPMLQRVESSPFGQSGSSVPTGGSGSGSGSGSGGGTGGTGSTGSTSGPATGATKLSAYRAVTTTGQVFTAGTAGKYGQPGAGSGAVVGIANPGWGDGFITVSASGHVTAYGGLPQIADATVPKGATAVDIAAAPSGARYWVLLSTGKVQAFGVGTYGSAKRATLATKALRIAARPQGDGYWILTDDGRVQGVGAAPTLASPGPKAASKPIDLAPTKSGKGYWVLMEDGTVAAYGDAAASQGMAGVSKRWTKPAVTIVRAGDGFVISARDGGLWPFAGAPLFGTFAGSGATVTGLVVAAR